MKGIIRSKGSERHSTNFIIFSYFYTGLQIRKWLCRLWCRLSWLESVNPLSVTPQNDQTHLNHFERVWPFCGVGVGVLTNKKTHKESITDRCSRKTVTMFRRWYRLIFTVVAGRVREIAYTAYSCTPINCFCTPKFWNPYKVLYANKI